MKAADGMAPGGCNPSRDEKAIARAYRLMSAPEPEVNQYIFNGIG